MKMTFRSNVRCYVKSFIPKTSSKMTEQIQNERLRFCKHFSTIVISPGMKWITNQLAETNFDEWEKCKKTGWMLFCDCIQIEEMMTMESTEKIYFVEKGVYCEIVQMHFILIEWDKCLERCTCDNIEAVSR